LLGVDVPPRSSRAFWVAGCKATAASLEAPSDFTGSALSPSRRTELKELTAGE
jgi:hypothetical protein